MIDRRFSRLSLATCLRAGVAVPAIAAMSVFAAAPVHAQNAQDDTPAADQKGDTEDDGNVIVVTARKRDESLADVPVSISVADSEKLSSAGISNLTDLFSTMPGVENNADGSRIANKPSIRGVGAQENASIRQKVTSFIDGVPMVGAQGIGAFAGLQRVEVLRGPQSAAFGRATFGGAINYVTRDPHDHLEASAQLGVATQGSYNASLLISGPIIGDDVRLLAVGERRKYGGPDEWKTTGGYQLGSQRSDLYAVKLGIGATEKFRAKIMYMHQGISDGHEPIQFANLNQLVPHPDNPVGRCSASTPAYNAASCVILGEVDSDAVPLIFNYDFDDAQNPLPNPGTRIKRDRVQGSVSTEFGRGYTLEAIGGYTKESGDTQLDRDTFDLSGMGTLHVGSTPNSTERYGEIRLSSPGSDRFNWLVGASIYDYDYSNITYSNVTAGTIMGIFSEGATNIGAFFNLGYRATDALTISIEGRYQRDEISALYPANAQRNAPNDIADTQTTKSFQPRLSLTYAVTDRINFYAQAARGNNPAGFNTIALDPILNQTATSQNFDLSQYVAFDEETVWSYEAGFKGSTADGRLGFAVAVYYLDMKGLVQPVTLNWTPTSGVLLPGTVSDDYFQRLFLNAGDFGGLGVELEFTWRPFDRLTLSGSASASGTEFGKNACSPIPLDYGVPADQSTPFSCVNIEGAQQPMVSKYTTSLAADYRFPITDHIDGFIRADHSWRSKRYVEVTNTEWIRGYHIVNLRAGIRTDRIKIEGFVANLFDDDTPTGAVRYFDGRLPGMTYNTTFQRRRPRQFGINLSYDL